MIETPYDRAQQYNYSLKMALRVPKSKFWDHFSIQTSPQNPQKHTLGTESALKKCFLAKKKHKTVFSQKAPNKCWKY